MEMCYAMRITCLTQKELTYSKLTLPRETRTNKSQYVEANQAGYRDLLAVDWKLEIFKYSRHSSYVECNDISIRSLRFFDKFSIQI